MFNLLIIFECAGWIATVKQDMDKGNNKAPELENSMNDMIHAAKIVFGEIKGQQMQLAPSDGKNKISLFAFLIKICVVCYFRVRLWRYAKVDQR